jgi:hypothetical protein
VLAFRGTANLKNIATDIKIAQTPLPELRPKGRGRIIIHCNDTATTTDAATTATATAAAAAAVSSSHGSSGSSSGATQQQQQQQQQRPRRRRTSRTAAATTATSGISSNSKSAVYSASSDGGGSTSEIDASLNSSVVYDSEYQQQQQQQQQQQLLLSGSTSGRLRDPGSTDDEVEAEGLYSAIEQFPREQFPAPAEQFPHSDECTSGDDSNNSNNNSNSNDNDNDQQYYYNDEQQQDTDVSDDVSALLFDNRSKGGLCWHLRYCLKAVVTRLPVFRQALPRVHSGFMEAYMRYYSQYCICLQLYCALRLFLHA